MHVRCPHCHQPVELVDQAGLEHIDCPSCGSHFNLLGEETVARRGDAGRTIGHFELVDQLGMGQFGTVWMARDIELDRKVAVKIPRQEQLSPGDVELFLREARAAAQLRHPNIVGVHEVGRDGETVFIVSDLVHGVTLADRLTAGRLSPHEAATLCATIADALHHAHQSGVIHRDLKPSNIMLDADGQPHLMDFGLAKREASEITMTMDGRILGTPAYMSPEQARGEAHHADARSDIYSLGTILFELLTGELPFRGNKRMLLMQIIHDEPPSPRKLDAAVPRDLETICLKCLEKSPDRRYSAARAVADELRRYLAGEPLRARPVSRMERSWRWCRRNPLVAGLTGCTLFLLVLLAVAGPLAAWRQSQLRQLASQARDEAIDARNEAAERALEAYASVVRANYTQANALRTAPRSERRKEALAYLQEAAEMGHRMQSLAKQSGAKSAANARRYANFWSEHLPSLNGEAAWWLVESSLQRITELRVRYGAPTAAQGTLRLPASALNSDGTLLACYAPTTKDAAAHIKVIELLTGAIRTQSELPRCCSTLQRTSEALEQVGIAFGSDGQEILVARADVFDAVGATPGATFRPAFSLERYDAQTGALRKALALDPAAVDSSPYADPSRLAVQFSSDRSRVLCTGYRSGLTGSPWPVRAIVYDCGDGREIRTWEDAQFFGATFGRNASELLALRRKDDDGAWWLEIVDIESGQLKRSLVVDDLLKNARYVKFPQLFWSMVAGRSHDHRWLALGDQSMLFFDLDTGHRLPAPLADGSFQSADVQSPCAFSSDGRLLATVTRRNQAKNESGAELTLKTFPEGRAIATHQLTDFPISEARSSYEPEPAVTLLAFLGDSYRVAVGRREKGSLEETITVCDAAVPRELWLNYSWPPKTGTPSRSSITRLYKPRKPVSAVRFDATGSHLLLAHGRSGGIERLPLPEAARDDSESHIAAPKQGIAEPSRATAWRYSSTARAYETVGPDRPFNENGEAEGWLSTNLCFDATSQVFIYPTRGRVDLYDAVNGNSRQVIDGRLVGASSGHRYLAVCRGEEAGAPQIAIFDVIENRWLPDLKDRAWAGTMPVNFSDDARLAWPDLRQGFCVARVADGATVYKNDQVAADLQKPVVDARGETAFLYGDNEKTSQGKALLVVDLASGNTIAVVGNAPNFNRDGTWARFSADGDWLAFLEPSTADFNDRARHNRLKLWTRGAPGAKQLGEAWSQNQAESYFALFASDRTHLVIQGVRDTSAGAASHDKQLVVELWDVAGPKLLRSSRDNPRDCIGHCSGLDGARLAVAYEDARDRNDKWLEIWDVANGDILAACPARLFEKRGVCGQFLLAAVHQQWRGWPLQIIDMATGKPSLKLDGLPPSKPIRVERFAGLARNHWQVTPGHDEDAVLWNLDDKTKHPLPLALSSLRGFSPDGKWLAAHESDGMSGLQLWDTSAHRLGQRIALEGRNRLPGAPESNVGAVRFSPDSRAIAFSIHEETRLANVEAGRMVAVLGRAGHGSRVRRMDVSDDGRLLATASDDQTVGLWNALDGSYVAMIEGFPSAVREAVFLAGSQHLAAVDAGGQVTVWRLESRKGSALPGVEARLIWKHSRAAGAPAAESSTMAVSPDGTLLAAVTADSTVTLFHANSGDVARTIETEMSLACLKFTPDGRWLAAGNRGGGVHLWESRTGEVVASWDGGQGAIEAVAVHPRDALLVTAGRDLRIWSVPDAQLLLVLRKHAEPVRDVTFSRDGRLLASAGDDQVVVWRLSDLGDKLAEMGLGWSNSTRQVEPQ